jgi:hypothetical protein
MTHVTLFPMLYVEYFHLDIRTFQRICSKSIMAIFYNSFMSCFPGMLRSLLPNDAPIITRISCVFIFHVRSISVIRPLYVIFFDLLLQ